MAGVSGASGRRPKNWIVYTRGMTNPWGFAFDYWGQSFSTDGAGWQGPHYCFPGVAYGMAVNVKETAGRPDHDRKAEEHRR